MMVLIWSNEHNAWWKPRSRGYTCDRRDAGVYTAKEAWEICQGANVGLSPTQKPNECIVPCEEKDFE